MFAKKINGITLVELMISLVIGLILISLLFKIYITAHRSYQLQTDLNYIRHGADRTIAVLSSELKQAGYIGCLKLNNDFPDIDYSSYHLNANNKIEIHDHMLVVQHASYQHAMLLSMQSVNILLANRDVLFSTGDYVIISDCNHAELMQIKSIKQNAQYQFIESVKPLQHSYNQTAELSLFIVNRFYIADTHRRYTNGQPIYALFIKDIHQQTSEVVEGVHNMDIKNNKMSVAIDFVIYTPSLQKSAYLYATK